MPDSCSEDPSFFLSDFWIRACLDTWPGHATFDRVDLPCGTGRSGYVILGRGIETRHRVLKVKVIAVNESVNPLLDEATIELNGIVNCTQEDFASGFQALVQRLVRDRSWDELRFFGLLRTRADLVQSLACQNDLRIRAFRERRTYWVDLDLVRGRYEGNYLASRSANTREQLRRSLRLVTKDLGEVTVNRAGSADEALSWLDQLAPLHRTRWPSQGQRSGFDNIRFVEFHRNLITSSFDSGVIDLLRIDAGSTTLAYLYNFRYLARSYFYLSAINYSHAERYRPGLLAHWLAIERSLAAGDRAYDLLAGDHQYKERLSTHRDLQRDLVIWRPRFGLRLEHRLRLLRRQWRDRRRDSRDIDALA